MVSKLAAALLAPLLIAIVWPVPEPNTGSAGDLTHQLATANITRPSAPTRTSHTLREKIEVAGFKPAQGQQRAANGAHGSPLSPLLSRTPQSPSTGAPMVRAPSTVTKFRRSTTTSPRVGLYNNLNSPGLNASINSVGFEQSPPDSTGAIGPNNYVEMVNSAIAVRNRNLALVSTSSLRDWVGVTADTPANASFCDPQVQWDPAAGRWFYAFILCNPFTSYQEIDFGWSKTANPADLVSGWCSFYFETTSDLWDFPKLGHNSRYMIIGVNDYAGGTSFVGSFLFWIAKPASGATTCAPPPINGSPFLVNGDGLTETFTPVPVNTVTGATDGYVVSSYYPGTGIHKLAVWHLNSSGVLFQSPDVDIAAYAFPASAPELGSTNTIDTGDGRLTQAVGDATNGIWTQHTVDGPGGRSIVRWYELKLSGGILILTQQGDIASPTDFVFNGAISPRADAAGAAVIYNRSSLTIDPVIAAQIRLTATPLGSMEHGELVLGASAAADTDYACNNPNVGDPCRWGDYAGATPDPVMKSLVWGTSEIILAAGSIPAWADHNFALSFVTAPHAPTAVAATPADHSAYVSWTDSTFVPSSPITSYTITSYVGTTAGTQIVVGASTTIVHFTGLTNGVTYTFTVIATNSVGDSPESVHSSAVTPTRKAAQTTPAASSSRINIGPAPPSPPPARP
jgi:hypothetical protein